MRDGRGVSDTPDIKGAGDWFHADLVVQIAGFYAEGVAGKFPKVKTDADYNRELRVYAGKIARDDRVEGSHNGQLAAVFLGEITKCKKLNFHLGNLQSFITDSLIISPF